MTNIIYLTLGSILGGLSRYFLGGFVQKASASGFPFGTMAVNLLGCLIAGFVLSAGENKLPLSESARFFLITGFCGAFTTFSALMFESDALLRSGQALSAFLNILISVTAGLAIFRLGFFLGKP